MDPTKLKYTVGKILVSMRKLQNLRQHSFSTTTGLSQSTISEMEQGKGLTIENLIAYCKGLDMPLSKLLLIAEKAMEKGYGPNKLLEEVLATVAKGGKSPWK